MAPISALVTGLTRLTAYAYGPETERTLTKIGYFRQLESSPLLDPADLVVLNDTVQCEDLHWHAPANTLFTACDDVYETRFRWFPPLNFLERPDLAWASRGSIHTINPETKESTRLAFENWDSPFITHGIDVIADPAAEAAVYIFAVNHLPNETVYPRDGSEGSVLPSLAPQKTDSRVEVFHHVLGSATARHVRTIADPLIVTPNDIVAASPTSIYVANDHVNPAGATMRTIENLFPGIFYSNVVHIALADVEATDGSVEVTVAADELLNPNGIRRGRTDDEILIASAGGGYFSIGSTAQGDGTIVVSETIDYDSTIDNPTWFVDTYASTGGDASGFIIAGPTRAINSPDTAHDPAGREGAIIWYTTPSKTNSSSGWDTRMLWQDDGSVIRNTATALLIGIDPAEENGAKKAWLFVSGVSSMNTIAVKVDL